MANVADVQFILTVTLFIIGNFFQGGEACGESITQ